MLVLRTFSGAFSKTKKIIKEGPGPWLSPAMMAGSLGISLYNIGLNSDRRRRDSIYQRQQLQEMSNLTDAMKETSRSMNKVDKSLHNVNGRDESKSDNNNKPKKNKILGFFNEL